jgi:hypothetical protein
VDHAELRAILGGSVGVVIMCPDAANAAAREALNVAVSELSPKKHRVLIAESFGGNDEPVDKLTADLVGLGIDPELTLRVKATPTEQACAGRHLWPPVAARALRESCMRVRPQRRCTLVAACGRTPAEDRRAAARHPQAPRRCSNTHRTQSTHAPRAGAAVPALPARCKWQQIGAAFRRSVCSAGA